MHLAGIVNTLSDLPEENRIEFIRKSYTKWPLGSESEFAGATLVKEPYTFATFDSYWEWKLPTFWSDLKHKMCEDTEEINSQVIWFTQFGLRLPVTSGSRDSLFFHTALDGLEDSELFTDFMIKRYLDYKWTQVWGFSRIITLIYATYVVSIIFFHPWWYLFIWFVYQSSYELI